MSAENHIAKPVADGERLLDALFIVDHLPEGIAVVDAGLRVLWANSAFSADCNVVGQVVGDALKCPDALQSADIFATARSDKVSTALLSCGEDRWLNLRVVSAPGNRFVVHIQDVTASERRRQKIAALHHAGKALNNLDADQLAEMNIEERKEVLKHNIRQFLHRLLNYDVIDLRLLDRATGELVPLLEEGMPEAAVNTRLFAREAGNGVTGYVAATGRGYLCRDTVQDSRYIAGCAGAKSSLTVPLLLADEVIGTLNIESPKVDAFNEGDLIFAETFGREIAQALHTLELLSAEKSGTAAASVEAVSREIALPADEILNTATRLLSRTSDDDRDTVGELKQIIGNIRSIRQSIQAVGEGLAPPRVANAKDAAIAEALKGKFILVVDSDERIRQSAHVLLGKYGCHVETARTGREAIDMARAGRYHAFLLDIRLPDGQVYDSFRTLRELQPEARPVMMAAFGYDASHTLVKARQEGPLTVLFKPFRNDQVLDALAGPRPLSLPVVP